MYTIVTYETGECVQSGFLHLAVLSRLRSRSGPVPSDKGRGARMYYAALSQIASPFLFPTRRMQLQPLLRYFLLMCTWPT